LLRPIQLDPALIGQTLPFDLFSETGVLLAGAGMPLTDAAHFEKLAARPLYQQMAPGPDAIQPLQRLHDIAAHTAKLLAGPQANLSEEELRLLARAFVALYRVDPDACLGYPRLIPVGPSCMNHDLHVLFICIMLADHLDFSEAQTESLAAAALTMNMSDIPLHERLYDGFVSGEDWVRLRAHPDDAANLLQRVGVTDPDWLECIRQHHENMDGSGYPGNLKGGQISLAARILRVADVYCSKIGARHYRPPKSTRVAFKELFGAERSYLDSQIASLLLRRIGLFPPGTLVRLANRECACITRPGRNGRIRFAISFLDARGRPLDTPRERDLTTRIYAARNLLNIDPLWPKIIWSRLWGYQSEQESA
jgi:hypothetical protein